MGERSRDRGRSTSWVRTECYRSFPTKSVTKAARERSTPPRSRWSQSRVISRSFPIHETGCSTTSRALERQGLRPSSVDAMPSRLRRRMRSSRSLGPDKKPSRESSQRPNAFRISIVCDPVNLNLWQGRPCHFLYSLYRRMQKKPRAGREHLTAIGSQLNLRRCSLLEWNLRTRFRQVRF